MSIEKAITWEQNMDVASEGADITQPTITESLSSTLDKKFNNQYDVLPDIYREMEIIKNEAIKNWNFMKWPDWKESNLEEKQRLLVRTKAFKAWFGDWENDKENSSKVLDKNWEPLVVYHGTDRKINIFDLSKNEANVSWFTTDKKYAAHYAEKLGSNIVESFFLNIRNPYGNLNEIEALDDLHTQMVPFYKSTADWQGIKPDGYIGHDTYSETKRSNGYEIAITSPNQVKSIDNYWLFSGWNNNIKY